MKLLIAKYLFGFDPNKGEKIPFKKINQTPPQLKFVSKDLKNKYIRVKSEKFNSIFNNVYQQLKNGN